MKIDLPYIPERTEKPRESGITMMMDKGLGPQQVEGFIEAAARYTDVVKLGFGSSYFSEHLEKKLQLYKEAGIQPYLGGTFFEAFIARDMFDEYRRLLDELGLQMAEVSDGSVIIPHEKKCEYIRTLSKDVTVLSEVGSKEEGILISPGKWINMMLSELESGSWKVIAEARESGNVGIYRPNGTAHTVLVNKIVRQVPQEKIIWETPKKPQQVWFIDLLGANVNLGNIGHEDVIPLETLRCGLRGDTFFNYLPNEVIERIT